MKEFVPPQSPANVLELLPPYPIVLVTTRTNAITINQVMYFTFKPLRIGVAIAHGRYTYSLLQEENEFVINNNTNALMCGRHNYSVSGPIVSPR